MVLCSFYDAESLYIQLEVYEKVTNLTVFIKLPIRFNCSLNQSPRKPFRVILNLADNVELTLLHIEELIMLHL